MVHADTRRPETIDVFETKGGMPRISLEVFVGSICCALNVGREGGSYIGTRKPAMRGASNGFSFAGCVLPQRFLREGIELSHLNVALELTIPRLPVKRQEPVPKLCKLLRGQSLDLVLDSFNFAHDTSLAVHARLARSGVQRYQGVNTLSYHALRGELASPRAVEDHPHGEVLAEVLKTMLSPRSHEQKIA